MLLCLKSFLNACEYQKNAIRYTNGRSFLEKNSLNCTGVFLIRGNN